MMGLRLGDLNRMRAEAAMVLVVVLEQALDLD